MNASSDPDELLALHHLRHCAVIGSFSSPIQERQTSHARIYGHFLSRNVSLVSAGLNAGMKTATPSRRSVDADQTDLDEEEDNEWSWCFSVPVCSTFIDSVSPPNLLSLPSRGSSPPRSAAVPLRC